MKETSPLSFAKDNVGPLVFPDAIESLIPGNHVDAFVPNAHVLEQAGYLAFYGFNEPPFADALQPRFYFQTDGHEEALSRVREAVRHGMSLALVTGPCGSGKSLVSQLLLRDLDGARTQAVLVLAAPGMSRVALLKAILSELGQAPRGGMAVAHDLVQRVHERILDMHREGRRLIVLVDECHFLPADSLHLIRTLTNLETEEQKLVTIVLFGESGFVRRLRHPSYASLLSRIVLHAELRPMDAAATEQYVKFRVMMAGRMDELFSSDAFAPLYEETGGIARRVNACCTRALLAGARRRATRIDADLIRMGCHPTIMAGGAA